MRKQFVFSAFWVGVLMTFQSCSKQSAHEMAASPAAANIINATIAANQTYQLTLDNSASVSIAKQASHFKVSQTELDSKSGLLVYRYVPAMNYTGTDEVVISNTNATVNESRVDCYTNYNNTSSDISYTTSYTTIKILITN